MAKRICLANTLENLRQSPILDLTESREKNTGERVTISLYPSDIGLDILKKIYLELCESKSGRKRTLKRENRRKHMV